MPQLNASDWLESNFAHAGRKVTLDDDQRRCVEVLTSFSAIYNLPTPGSVTESIELFPKGLSVLLVGQLATFDFDGLTRLVVAAHDHAVRVSLSPYHPHLDEERAARVRRSMARCYDDFDGDADDLVVEAMELQLHARTRDGEHLYERHPDASRLAELSTASQ